MNWFASVISGSCPVQKGSSEDRRLSAVGARTAFLTVVLLVCCGLFGHIILCKTSLGQTRVPADFAILTGVGAIRGGRRRDGRSSADPPIDPSVRAASYARFSSALQNESSIADQRRKCCEMAATNGHAISRELEFSDEAVSGTKRHRDGLDAMLAAAEAGEFNVLYFHSLSRLSRESVITLPLLKQLVYNYSVRVVSCTEGIDSDDTAWELIAHIMSIVHEQYLKNLAENVLKGQEGAVLAGFSVGDHCLGFNSAPIPGSEQGRRGRNTKPRKMYVIDPETAAWVDRIFHWFVHQRRSLRWIARELNRLGAPKDHRASTKEWRHQYVPRLLQNKKYVGKWPWGQKKNVRDPLTGKIRQEDRSPDECEKWMRHLPHLQLIDNETFEEAQRLLRANQEKLAGSRKKKGRLNGSKPGAAGCHPRHLLSQLIVCSHCGRTFHVGGRGGKYLFCPGHNMGTCTCRTQLRRDRAERMILAEVGQHILENSAWRQLVLEETLDAWNAQESAIPSELAAAEKGLADVELTIKTLVDRAEGKEEIPELSERLAQRRAEKQDFEERVERLRRVSDNRRPVPTEVCVDERLRHLGEVLSGDNPAATHALRELVGGRIVVTKIRQSGRERHHLQGRFAIRAMAIARAITGPDDVLDPSGTKAGSSDEEEIVIDFREPTRREIESERAKQLYDEGLMNAEIAQRLGCSRSRVTALLKFWFESRGLEMPDGRSRRATLKRKHQEPPLYQKVAEEVMALYRQDKLLQDIADALNVDRNTVTAAIRWWHETHDLPVPDGRARRKDLEQKVSPKTDTSDARSAV